jgi:hypothetical protein
VGFVVGDSNPEDDVIVEKDSTNVDCFGKKLSRKQLADTF